PCRLAKLPRFKTSFLVWLHCGESRQANRNRQRSHPTIRKRRPHSSLLFDIPMNPQDRIPYILETAAQKMAEINFQDEPLSCAPDTVLLGDGACLDSMGFVNFIVAVEDSIERELRMNINLSEEL